MKVERYNSYLHPNFNVLKLRDVAKISILLSFYFEDYLQTLRLKNTRLCYKDLNILLREVEEVVYRQLIISDKEQFRLNHDRINTTLHFIFQDQLQKVSIMFKSYGVLYYYSILVATNQEFNYNKSSRGIVCMYDADHIGV